MNAVSMMVGTTKRNPDESGVFLLASTMTLDLPVNDASPRQDLTLVQSSQDQMIESDMKLISQLLLNRPAAWREFQTRYERLISRCIMKVTRRFSSIVSQDDVREIYAQLFVSLLTNDMHKLRSFDPTRGNRFSSWVGLLAINCAYDYLRALRREPNKAALSEAADLVCDLPDPFDQASNNERAALAARMLDGFSEKDRAFATLYFAEGMDPVEIAARMNISVKTVYSKKHKIQSRLESVLATGTIAA